MSDPYISSESDSSALIRSAREYLEEKGIEEAGLNAELLLAAIVRKSRTALRLNRPLRVTPDNIRLYCSYLMRRSEHEPLQYILGETEFYGEVIRLSPHVLIPRPETELLVDATLGLAAPGRYEPCAILDVGTGSGNIPIALARHLKLARIDAIDISREALATALENVRRHRMEDRISLIEADMADFRPDRNYDYIVSNPPYISEEEYLRLQPEITQFEPAVALTDHADGLTFFRAVIRLAADLLAPGGAIVLEIAYNQSDAVTDILRASGFSRITVLKDYGGQDRVVHARSGKE